MPFENPLNQHSLAFPILICVHLAGIVCGVGTAALVNLRLLGMGLTEKSAAQLWRDLLLWTVGGLTVAIFSGLLLFSIDPDVYYTNRIFLSKMLFLVLALAFYFAIVRKEAVSGLDRGRIVASISLGLWTLVPFGGIFIGSSGSLQVAVLLSLHIAALIALGGMVLVTNVRLLGGISGSSSAEIVKKLRVPKRVAFAVVAICGLLVFLPKAAEYSRNPWFWIKIGLLGLMAANYFAFRRKPKLMAGVSLFLSAGVLGAARGPATVKDIMHSMIEPSGDYLFQSVQTIADEHGVREKAPQTQHDWDNVRDRLTILNQLPALFSGSGLRAAHLRDRSKNAEVEDQPEEVQQLLDAERSDFIVRARRLQDAASVAMQAVEAKDKDALRTALDGIDKACESCHVHYWYPKDKRAREAAKENGVIE